MRRKGKMCRVLSSRISSSGSCPAPASSQGGVFPISMPVLSISVCQGIQVGVYPLHTRRTFPISFSLSQDSSHWIWFYPSPRSQLTELLLSTPLLYVVFLPFIPSKHDLLVLFQWLSVFPLAFSCTESTGSSWGTLPDGRPPVCWQRDNGGDRQGTTPPAAKGSAGGIIIITLRHWSRITATPLPPRSLVPTPNAKVTGRNVFFCSNTSKRFINFDDSFHGHALMVAMTPHLVTRKQRQNNLTEYNLSTGTSVCLLFVKPRTFITPHSE